MAEFVSFDKNVEVNGATVLSVVNGMGAFKRKGEEILAKHGIENINPEGWYSQQKWLNAFKEIAAIYGERTLENIGKAIPENALFPPDIDDAHKAVASIDVAYKMNHRRGSIGHYKYSRISDKSCVVECKNPYPSAFDKGIILGMVRRFGGGIIKVTLDPEKPSRKDGADSCTFIVEW